MNEIRIYAFLVTVGLTIGFIGTMPSDLRRLRLMQMVLVPVLLSGMYFQIPKGPLAVEDLLAFLLYLWPLGMLAALLAPNIAWFCGYGIQSAIDPQDWTSCDEEIVLKPVNQLIEREDYQAAYKTLEDLLERHRPTYHALLLRAKLQYHFGKIKQARQTLLKMIELAQHPDQQLAAMRLYHELAVA
jgi:tetratricopeptide (TPR) repeat protein